MPWVVRPDDAPRDAAAGSATVAPARLVTFAAPAGSPRSTFYPDDETVLVHISDTEGYRFNLSDQIDDHWDGEPGAGT